MAITIRSPKLLLKQWQEQKQAEGGLTDEEYEFLLEDIENAIRESNASFIPKPTKIPPIILSEKDRAICLVYWRSKAMAADPEAKERSRIMLDGVDF